MGIEYLPPPRGRRDEFIAPVPRQRTSENEGGPRQLILSNGAGPLAGGFGRGFSGKGLLSCTGSRSGLPDKSSCCWFVSQGYRYGGMYGSGRWSSKSILHGVFGPLDLDPSCENQELLF